MIIATATAQAAPSRFSRPTVEGPLIWRSEYFGPPPSPPNAASIDPNSGQFVPYAPPGPGEVRLPQAFLVEQEPGAVVHPHFHHVDQFQVVVGGGGTIGKHAVAPVSAHFAGAHTGYGPIVPGPDGLQYFSLRASADSTGAQYLPAARGRMRPGPRRNVFAPPVAPSTPETLAALGEPALVALIEEDDGLSVRYCRIPPGRELTLDGLDRGAGQSIIVTQGAIRHDGVRLDRLSAMFVAADLPAMRFHAEPEGAELLVLRYPRPS
jgi:hypothetical protein